MSTWNGLPEPARATELGQSRTADLTLPRLTTAAASGKPDAFMAAASKSISSDVISILLTVGPCQASVVMHGGSDAVDCIPRVWPSLELAPACSQPRSLQCEFTRCPTLCHPVQEFRLSQGKVHKQITPSAEAHPAVKQRFHKCFNCFLVYLTTCEDASISGRHSS
jgi:hypothetical protein